MATSKSSSDGNGPREERVLQAFEPDLSAIMARCVIRVALARLSMTLETLTPAQVPTLAAELKRGLRLYAPDSADSCMRRLVPVLDALASSNEASARVAPLGSSSPRGSGSRASEEGGSGLTRLPIESESDILLARHAVREMCGRLGFSRSEEVKAATVVSELARNIVLYAKRGEISLRRWVEEGRVGIEIRARDQGPGIANTEVILSGKYRSRTGLGLGILGTKRLAHQFEITSGVGGTEVVARMVVR
jgi:serine/threonine-protein kinase RsbT